LTGIIGCVTNAPNLIIDAPNPITGCIHYVSADQGIVSSNGLVSQWTDLSGNNSNLIQSDSTYQPTYKLNDTVMNNKPSVFFNSNHTYYMNCDTYSSNKTIFNTTLCMVAYAYSKTNYSIGFQFAAGINDVVGISWLIPMNCTDNIMTININNTWMYSFPSAYILLKPGVPFILVLTLSSTSTTITLNAYVNGSLVTGTSTSFPYIVDQAPNPEYYITEVFNLGNNLPDNGFYGAYSSFALYNTVLSNAQRQQVEGYLAWKWWGSGSAILSDPHHPYYSTQIGDIGKLFNPISVV